MITDIEDFFAKGCGRCERFATPACSANKWHDGLTRLRAICRSAGLVETVKWGHPCYMHAGRNIALIGALQGDFRLNFFNAALMKDPAGLLERQGPNTRHPDMIRFTALASVQALLPMVRSYLAQAMAHAAFVHPLRLIALIAIAIVDQIGPVVVEDVTEHRMGQQGARRLRAAAIHHQRE